MTLTNFPNGVSSFGIPMLGSLGIPFTGNHYFVDYLNGNDVNEGTADSPFKTLAHAYSLCVSGNNDVVYIIGNGGTSASQYLSAQLVWAKDATHLVGITAPSAFSSRARIAIKAGVTGFSPMVKVTGAGCFFSNFSMFHGYDTAETQIAWLESGQRNFYSNVHFGGVGHATAGDQTGSCSLHIDGGVGASTTGRGEHTFVNCVIGLDTIARSVANCNLKLSGATPRNVFRNCLFPAFADNAGALFVNVPDSGGIDRETVFDNCMFINAVKSTATAMTGGFNVHASAGGMLVLQNPLMVGATDYEASAASNNIFFIGPVPTAATTGLAINNAT